MKKSLSIFMLLIALFLCFFTSIITVYGDGFPTLTGEECPDTASGLQRASESVAAVPSPFRVIIDGKPIDFDAYIIDDYTFLKLRDLAFVLCGTPKQFEVKCDEESHTVNLLSNQPYTSAGDDLTRNEPANGSLSPAQGFRNTSAIFKNGKKMDLAAYNIGGYNYFKLRDIARELDFKLAWNEQQKTIEVYTSSGYVEENDTAEASVNAASQGIAYFNRPKVVNGFTVHPLRAISEDDLPLKPKSVQEFEDILYFMASTCTFEYEISYAGGIPGELSGFSETISRAFNNAFKKYTEFFSLFTSIDIDLVTDTNEGSVRLTLYNSKIDTGKLRRMFEDYLREADKIICDLALSSQLKDTMSQKERAEVLYRWMAYNLKNDIFVEAESYTGYGAAVNKKAVCQGYTGLYNLLCKKAGISIESVVGKLKPDISSSNQGHIWSLATLDGEKVYIDSTLSDPYPDKPGYCNMDFFAVDAETLRKTHEW